MGRKFYWIVLIIASLIFTSIQAQEIQKWVDEDGNVHFGTVPPQEAESETVEIEQQNFSTPDDAYDEGNKDSRTLTSAKERKSEAIRERVEAATAEVNRLKKENRDPEKCANQRKIMAYYTNKDSITGSYHPSYRYAETLAGFYCED